MYVGMHGAVYDECINGRYPIVRNHRALENARPWKYDEKSDVDERSEIIVPL